MPHPSMSCEPNRMNRIPCFPRPLTRLRRVYLKTQRHQGDGKSVKKDGNACMEKWASQFFQKRHPHASQCLGTVKASPREPFTDLSPGSLFFVSSRLCARFVFHPVLVIYTSTGRAHSPLFLPWSRTSSLITISICSSTPPYFQ